MSKEITIYAADWCSDCRRSKKLMDSLNVKYTLIDVEADTSAAAKVIEITGGPRSIPVIMFADGTHLVEPSDKVLKAKLEALAII